MRNYVFALALCLLGCSAPQYQGKVSVEGVALGDSEAQLSASGWKIGSDGKSWSRAASPKVTISPTFSSARKVIAVSGGALLDEQGKVLVAFGGRTDEIEKVLGSPDEWKKPEHPPGSGDPPAVNQMIYRKLKLVVDNDAREQSLERVTLSETP